MWYLASVIRIARVPSVRWQWWVVLGAAVVVVAAGLLWGSPAPRTRPPPTVRVVKGDVRRFEVDTLQYAPLSGPLTVDESFQTASETVLRLSDGGTVVLTAQTTFTMLAPRAQQSLRLRVKQGRLWLHLKGDERAEVDAFHARVTAQRGDCEINVYEDRDHFVNTIVMQWRGTAMLRGGERMNLDRPLSAGVSGQADDVRMYPLQRFDPQRTDDWQKRQLALP